MTSRAQEPPDQQVCFVYRLKPGRGPEYDRLHRQVWPQIRARIRARGTYDYSIFRRGELVISVLRRGSADGEGPDPATDELQAEWSATLAPLFEQINDDDGRPLYAERIFRLD